MADAAAEECGTRGHREVPWCMLLQDTFTDIHARWQIPLVYIMHVHLHTCIDKYIHAEAHMGFCSIKLFIQTSQSSSDRVNCSGIKDEAVETG